MYTRYLKVEGDAFSRGKEIGASLKEQILANYANQKRHYDVMFNYDFDDWAKCCEKYVPILEKYAPETLSEIKGMAAGSELPFNQILALSTAYEKSFGCDQISDKCTSFSAYGEATTDGLMICGQTNDERMDEWAPELDLTIHHKSESNHEMMIYAHPGNVAYMGCNNKGITILWTYIDNGLKQDGLPTNIIIREALSKESYEETVKFIQTIPHAIPNYFKVCHRDKGATGLECFPNKVYTSVYGPTSAHANHNIFSPEEPDKTISWSTNQRQKNMTRLLQENFGKINVAVAKEFFKDHTDFPFSICTHPNRVRPMAKTLCAMVYDMGKGELHITHSNPCEYPYLLHKFDNYNFK